MPHFYYKAISRDGVADEGEMVEANSAAVIRRLQDGGFIPILTEEITPGRVKRGRFRLPDLRRKAARPDLVAFTRSLTSLLGSGTALDRALDIMLEVEVDLATRSLIEDVQLAVRSGASLSQAFDDQDSVFSGFYVSMVRAAEASGTLSDGLERMLEYLERSRELREKIVSALIYPIILFVVAGLSVLILLTLVVPQFRPIFEEMGAALPFATRVVLATSDFLASYWWLLPVVIVGLVLWMRRVLENPHKRLQLDAMSLRLPLFGPLMIANETARFCRSLGTLLQNGVPVLQGLEIGRNTLTNRALIAAVDDASASLKGGGNLSGTLQEAAVFPGLAIQMVKVGEESGNLDEMMLRVSKIYEGEVSLSIQRLLAMVEPVLIIGLGIMIAGIIMSILVGVISINDLPV